VGEGTYRLEVRLDPNKPPLVGMTIVAGSADLEITVPAEPAKRTTLEVVDGEGKPVPQASIIQSSDQGVGTSSFYDGRWRLPSCSGEAWVEVHSPATAAGA